MTTAKGDVECKPLEPKFMSFCWTPSGQLEFIPIVFLFLILQVSSSTLHTVHVICNI